jgi:hypothetical protein
MPFLPAAFTNARVSLPYFARSAQKYISSTPCADRNRIRFAARAVFTASGPCHHQTPFVPLAKDGTENTVTAYASSHILTNRKKLFCFFKL